MLARVQTLGILGQLALDVDEGLDVLFQVGAHHALHRMAVEADDLREHRAREHRHAAGFFFQDDLQQDAAREFSPDLASTTLKSSVSMTSCFTSASVM
jgi:hypothetical protein